MILAFREFFSNLEVGPCKFSKFDRIYGFSNEALFDGTKVNICKELRLCQQDQMRAVERKE